MVNIIEGTQDRIGRNRDIEEEIVIKVYFVFDTPAAGESEVLVWVGVIVSLRNMVI